MMLHLTLTLKGHDPCSKGRESKLRRGIGHMTPARRPVAIAVWSFVSEVPFLRRNRSNEGKILDLLKFAGKDSN